MFEAKYIVTYHNRFETIFMFPNFVTHVEFAERMSVHPTAILSAGFVVLTTDELGNPTVSTYGKSESLDIKSRPEDKNLAEKMFNVTRY
jgi:hypothetical protein